MRYTPLQKFRKDISEAVKAELKCDVPLTIHWDGKLLEDITGEEVVDRLPVLVSGNGVDQLLGVPKLSSGTGENTSAAVFKLFVANDTRERCFTSMYPVVILPFLFSCEGLWTIIALEPHASVRRNTWQFQFGNKNDQDIPNKGFQKLKQIQRNIQS